MINVLDTINGEGYERILLLNKLIDEEDYDQPWLEQPGYYEVKRVNDLSEANLFASECTDGMHRLAIDVDCADRKLNLLKVLEKLSAFDNVRYWESSTPGNYHIVADNPMTWGEYEDQLYFLRMHGIIQDGYFFASIERKRTQLRLPHIKKVSNA